MSRLIKQLEDEFSLLEKLTNRDSLKILDYCCGSGGKSLALHSWTTAKIFAYDAFPERTNDLRARAERAKAKILNISKPINDRFDVIFL